MDLNIPTSDNDFFKYLWRIMGWKEISKSELIRTVSYKIMLPYSPSHLNKKIITAIKKGYLIEQGNKITISKNILNDLEKEKEKSKNYFPILFPTQCIGDRIEESIDIWRYSEKKSGFIDLMKQVFNKSEIENGKKIQSEKIQIKDSDEKNQIIEAMVEGSKGERYILKIDIKNKIIIHDCHDFIQNKMKKNEFCKHFFRTILKFKKSSPELVELFLNRIKSNRDRWQFLDHT
jgi:hypothetical protein